MKNREPVHNSGAPEQETGGESGEARIALRFRHLLEAAPDAILEVDREGSIILMNAATERLFGYSREELTGKNVDTLVPNEVRDRHVHHRANYSAHPLPRPMGSGLLLQGQRKDGTRFPVEISLSPFESDEGFRIGAIIRDVTDRIQAEEQIRALQARYTEELTAANRQLELRNREVEAANQLKSEFLASVSHEFRTPLHTIIGFAELLREGREGLLSNKQLGFLNHILTDGRHLLELINDILDLSKIEAGRLDLKMEKFEWTEVLRDVVTTIQPQALSKGVVLHTPADVPSHLLWADPVRFKAIFYNLLSNAVKFTHPGGRVWVDAELGKAVLRVTVHDTGIGIPSEIQDRIFDKFYQAGITTKGIREGTGLGLSITKHLVERHGGTMFLQSTPGQGSAFSFTIPLEAHEMQPQADTGKKSGIQPPLLLILQGDVEARGKLEDFSEGQGYRTDLASDAGELVEKVRELRPSAILLDVLGAGGEGWRALRELRGNPATKGLPVVLVSGAGPMQLSDAVGSAECLRKPVDVEALLGTLRQQVRTHPGNPPKILVISPVSSTRAVLREGLGRAGYLPILNEGGREALETLAKTEVSAVVVELQMAEMNGFEVMFRVREQPRFRDLPLLMLTAKDLSAMDVEALRRSTRAVFLTSATWREDLLSQLRGIAPGSSHE